MKKLLALLAVGLVFATTAMDADAARRFGGGSSFGRSAPALRQAAPQPTAPKFGQQAQKNPGAQAQKPAAAGAAANAAKPSPWRGILMGAAAALGITALLSALGLSEGFAQILMAVLLAVAVFYVIRLVMRLAISKRQPRPMAASSANYGSEQTQFKATQDSYERQQTVSAMPSSVVGNTVSGSVMDMFNREAQSPDAAGPAIPEGFDKIGFETVAKENFVKLQRAWDSGSVVEISDFTTDDLFITITHQLRARGAQKQTSEVINLECELLGILKEENVAVVEFNGAMKISGEFEEVHERWILTRAVDESTGWLLAGIEQVEERN